MDSDNAKNSVPFVRQQHLEDVLRKQNYNKSPECYKSALEIWKQFGIQEEVTSGKDRTVVPSCSRHENNFEDACSGGDLIPLENFTSGDKSFNNAKSLSKENVEIMSVVNEILDNERKYIVKLNYVYENYLMQSYALGDEVHGMIFGNFLEIKRFHEQSFYPDLQACNKDYVEIMHCFSRHLEAGHLYIYIDFLVNQSTSETQVRIPVHKQLLEKIQLDNGDKLGLLAHLTEIVQRLFKYKNLIESVLQKVFRYQHDSTAIAEVFKAGGDLHKLINTCNKTLHVDIVDFKIDRTKQGIFLAQHDLTIFDSDVGRRYRGKVFLFQNCVICTECVGGKSNYKACFERKTGEVEWINSGRIILSQQKNHKIEIGGDIPPKFSDIITTILRDKNDSKKTLSMASSGHVRESVADIIEEMLVYESVFIKRLKNGSLTYSEGFTRLDIGGDSIEIIGELFRSLLEINDFHENTFNLKKFASDITTVASNISDSIQGGLFNIYISYAVSHTKICYELRNDNKLKDLFEARQKYYQYHQTIEEYLSLPLKCLNMYLSYMERAVAALETDGANKATEKLVSVSTAIETLKNFLNIIQMWIADTTKKLSSIRKMQTIKCVLVGSSVGKTSLIVSYKNKDFEAPEKWPIPFEKIEETVVIDDEPYTLQLVDTGSQEAYDCYRPFSYIDADVFLVCYSVVLPYSVDYVMEKWLPEIRQFCPNKPFLLVGTQIDLRYDKKILNHLSQTPTSIVEGVKLAKKLKAVKYVECSAKFQDTVKNVFDEAIRATVIPSEKPKPTRRFKLF